jgi:hypothetical protein
MLFEMPDYGVLLGDTLQPSAKIQECVAVSITSVLILHMGVFCCSFELQITVSYYTFQCKAREVLHCQLKEY